jgi:excisionase family DNA binding protein
VNQSRNCSALSSSEKEQPEETEVSAGYRSGRPMAPLLLKAGQVAQLLGLGRSTVFALLAAGELPVIRIGRSVRVPRVALERRTHRPGGEPGRRPRTAHPGPR